MNTNDKPLNMEIIDRIKANILKATWDNYYMPTKLLSYDEISEIIDSTIEGDDNDDT